MQGVEDEEVGDQPVAARARAGADKDDLPPIHRRADVIGREGVAEQGGEVGAARRRSIRFVTGVIASGARRGKRSSKNCRTGGDTYGSTAARHSSSLSRTGISKIVGASSAGS